MLKLPFFLVLALMLAYCQPKNDSQSNQALPPGFLDIREFGAVGDGKTLCTEAFAKAFEEAEKVGGTVYVPAGTYLTGTVELKSNTTLHVSKKGVIKGSAKNEDYKLVSKVAAEWRGGRQCFHLIYCRGAKNISLEGEGTIDGSGASFWQDYDSLPVWIMHKNDSGRDDHYYSNMVELVDIENLKIRDLHFTNSPEWTVHLFDCNNVEVRGITIINNLYGPNNDGLDMSGVQNVMVSNCYIKTCDDGICLKTFPNSQMTKNVTVTNCVVWTSCAALKCGEVYADMKDITFSNCVVRNSSRAVAVYGNLSGNIDNMTVSNIIVNTNAPLVLNRPIQVGCWSQSRKLYDGKDTTYAAGTVSNLTIQNVTATTEGRMLFTATDGGKIRNLSLQNIRITYPYIEDPKTYGPGATSSQFKGVSKEAKSIRAAMAFAGVDGLYLDNVVVDWPRQTAVPQDWQHPVRIENGNMNRHFPDYSTSQTCDMSVVYLENVSNHVLNLPQAKASSPSVPVVLKK